MKHLSLFFLPAFIALVAQSQTYYQLALGPKQGAEIFSVKYDAGSGGTVSAGYLTNNSQSPDFLDLFIFKADKNNDVVWQKKIANPGADYFYKVTVCKNGDYLAAGTLTKNGIHRGYICRMKRKNGDVIWSAITNNSPAGELCYDVIETNDGNIAIAATDSLQGNRNCFIMLLDAAGNKLWSEISQYDSTNEPYSIAQLPNNNLLVTVGKMAAGYNNLVLIELKESDGSMVTQNAYSIHLNNPANPFYFYPLAADCGINIINKQVSLSFYAFARFKGKADVCIYKYHTDTKELTGNIYFHQGATTVEFRSFSYVPVAENDYIISEAPENLFISRITNGRIVYDNSFWGAPFTINSIDTTGDGMVLAGSSYQKGLSDIAYNLFAPRTNPIAVSCNLKVANTLKLIHSDIMATPSTDISFVAGGVVQKDITAFEDAGYPTKLLCGNAEAATNDVTAAQQPLAKEKLLTAIPNPATASVRFSIPFTDKPTALVIYNMNGKKIFEEQLQAGVTSKDINIKAFAPGVYNAVLAGNNERLSVRFIKQ